MNKYKQVMNYLTSPADIRKVDLLLVYTMILSVAAEVFGWFS